MTHTSIQKFSRAYTHTAQAACCRSPVLAARNVGGQGLFEFEADRLEQVLLPDPLLEAH